MAKEKKPVVKVRKAVKMPPKGKHHSYFPTISIFFGLILIIVAVLDYLDYYTFSIIVIDALLVLAGLRILHWGLSKGYYKRHKEILKKYI
jgi:hypothetical protein